MDDDEFLFSKYLESIKDFDSSDIRLIEKSTIDCDGSIEARYCGTHIEIYTQQWGLYFPPANTVEYIEYVINHEILHYVIDKIMLNDKMDMMAFDVHYPFYAGEIDFLHGVSSSNLNRNFFESPESIKTTIEVFKRTLSKPPLDFSKWTWV